MANTLETRSILHMCHRQKAFFSASFRDEARHIYVLDIVVVDPDALEVVFRAPVGRSTPLNPLNSWQVTFSNHRGAYRTKLRLMTHESDDTLRVRLHPDTVFLARRKSIRLPPDSRNPTLIQFHFGDVRAEGTLVDFSLEGFGLEVTPDLGLKIGDTLNDGSCMIQGIEVGFRSARIVQKALLESHVRLGLEFKNLSGSQEEAIQNAFHQCFSRQSTISTVLDG